MRTGARTPLYGFLESDAKKVEHKDQYPSTYPTDGAHEDAQPVDRDVVVEHEVRQEEKNHPQDGVANEPRQTEAPPHENEGPKHYHYEDDQLRTVHNPVLSIPGSSTPKTSRSERAGAHPGRLTFALPPARSWLAASSPLLLSWMGPRAAPTSAVYSRQRGGRITQMNDLSLAHMGRSSVPAVRDADSTSRGHLVSQSLEEVLVQRWGESSDSRVFARRVLRSSFTTGPTDRPR